jgi:hypothetical protein
MKNDMRAWLAALALGVAMAGCSDMRSDRSMSPSITGPSLSQSNAQGEDEDDADDDKTIYDQTDFLGNPLVSEVTIAKANHGLYNRTQPYNTATFLPQTAAFVTSFGRPLALAQLLGSVLYPDILIVDASKNPNTAGWLSWALANGWGGRKAVGRRRRSRPHRDFQQLSESHRSALRAVRAAALHGQRRQQRQGILAELPVSRVTTHLRHPRCRSSPDDRRGVGHRRRFE